MEDRGTRILASASLTLSVLCITLSIWVIVAFRPRDRGPEVPAWGIPEPHAVAAWIGPLGDGGAVAVYPRDPSRVVGRFRDDRLARGLGLTGPATFLEGVFAAGAEAVEPGGEALRIRLSGGSLAEPVEARPISAESVPGPVSAGGSLMLSGFGAPGRIPAGVWRKVLFVVPGELDLSDPDRVEVTLPERVVPLARHPVGRGELDAAIERVASGDTGVR